MSVDKQLARVAVALCDSVGSELSTKVKQLIQSGDVRSLVSIRIDPRAYTTPYDYLKDASVVSLLRKVPFNVPGIDRKAAALASFWAGEAACCKTNRRFSNFLNNDLLVEEDLRVLEFLEPARRWIRKVLGPLPEVLVPKFGPGSTFRDRGRLTTVPDKMTSCPTLTRGATCLLPFWERTAWYRSSSRSRGPSIEYVRGNRFTTVPKDALKDRGICIEPSLNVAFQLPIGKYLKERLLVNGIDLVLGQERHRSWACRASRDGKHATLDLSNASDTVSYLFVKYMLPPDWFSLLDSLRSPFTEVNGKWVKLEKFSSMGNGFTFELESLLFASLCQAFGGVAGSDFSVFGDDIICPSGSADSLVALLSFCGFTLNLEKSFLSGPFRESCGGDFFEGRSVRPFFLKEQPNEPQEWISLANGLRRMGRQDPSPLFRYCYSFLAWQRVLDNIPATIRRLRGPESLGDLVIHDDQFSRRFRNGIGFVKVFRPVAKPLPWHHWRPDVVYASILYGAGDSRGVIPRGSVSGYKIGYVAYS